MLLCTDSSDVQSALIRRVPGVICRNKLFRKSGEGELHHWRGASLGRDDALVELLLLAECDALIRYPPGSFFSFYAAVMKPYACHLLRPFMNCSVPATLVTCLRRLFSCDRY